MAAGLHSWWQETAVWLHCTTEDWEAKGLGPEAGSTWNPQASPPLNQPLPLGHFENTLIGKRGVIFKILIQEIQSATPGVETAVHIYVCAFSSKFWLPALRQRMASFKVDHVSQHYTLKDKN